MRRGALGVSFAGILLPFAFGALLALGLRGRSDLFAPTVSAGEGALYLGASMCITAFPMLARILVERGLAKTAMGTPRPRRGRGGRRDRLGPARRRARLLQARAALRAVRHRGRRALRRRHPDLRQGPLPPPGRGGRAWRRDVLGDLRPHDAHPLRGRVGDRRPRHLRGVRRVPRRGRDAARAVRRGAPPEDGVAHRRRAPSVLLRLLGAEHEDRPARLARPLGSGRPRVLRRRRGQVRWVRDRRAPLRRTLAGRRPRSASS